MGRRTWTVEMFLVMLALAGMFLSVGYTVRKTPGSNEISRRAVNFNPTVARLERGRYLVEGPAHCFQCHSEVDWQNPVGCNVCWARSRRM